MVMGRRFERRSRRPVTLGAGVSDAAAPFSVVPGMVAVESGCDG